MLSEKQMSDPNFMRCGEVSNEALQFAFRRLGLEFDVTESAGNRLVDDMTAILLRAARKQRTDD